MPLLGLIGYPLSHSFSADFFARKFEQEGITDYQYRLFPITSVALLPELISAYPDLRGLNVTIPYKTSVLPYVDELSNEAREIGAVNTLKIQDGRIYGCNTDCYGFRESLLPLLRPQPDKALVLGAGGAARAVCHVLASLGINYLQVTRNRSELTYADLTGDLIQEHLLIINATPLGMWPNINTCPPIPYEALTPAHVLYDLVYNPAETLFMQKGREQGAQIVNGLLMLKLQAEKSWEIWSDNYGGGI
jgi:shikimate dehydrogenase